MSSPSLTSRNHAQALYPLALVLIVAGVFSNGLGVPFLLDDEISVGDNESIRRLTPIRDVLWPRTEVFTAGRPLLNLTFALNYAVGGLAVRGYHVVNLAIHALATLALFGVVRRMLLRPNFTSEIAARAAPLAFFSALLWALHPLQTNSVTYISQRAESLMGLCYLGTLYCFVRYAESSRRGWSVLAVAICVGGMLSKEVMVTAPVLLLLFDRMFFATSFRQIARERGGLFAALFATWGVLGVMMLATRMEDRGVGYTFFFTWHQYLRVEFGAVLHYVRLALFPHPLVFDYGPRVPVPGAGMVLLYSAVLAGMALATFVAWRRRFSIGFVGLWFFALLAPTSSFVPVAGQPIAENRLYLPVAAWVVLLVVASYAMAGRRAFAGLAALALAMAVMTSMRNNVFRSEISIWHDTALKRPNSARAFHYYGTALVRSGKFEAGIEKLNTALSLAADYGDSHANLGSAYVQLGRMEDALRHLQIAITRNPKDPFRYSNLGTALFHLGRTDEALALYQEALRIRPHFVDAQVNMGIVLARLGRFDEAMALLEEATRLHPHHPAAVQQRDALRAFLAKRSAP